jgi:hypothetical protein
MVLTRDGVLNVNTKLILAATLVLSIARAFAHDDHGTNHETLLLPIRIAAERHPPVKPRLTVSKSSAMRTSGEGGWTFMAATNVLPIPAAAHGALKGAHGTLIADSDRDTVYWGLQGVGWIAFSNSLTESWIVRGDPKLAEGNLHGAELIERSKGQLPLVAAADNVKHRVFVSDTAFTNVQVLGYPANSGKYTSASQFNPTDATWVNTRRFWVTDGYGEGWVLEATTAPLDYTGLMFGGHSLSQTPHGVTYDPATRDLIVSARPEGKFVLWSLRNKAMASTHALPGSEVNGKPSVPTVCDLELWRNYAVAPCLDGPGGTPGPIYILNRKKWEIVSVIAPKTELGFTEAQHIHDAMLYEHKGHLWLLFTYWNPGGIGAAELVRVTD